MMQLCFARGQFEQVNAGRISLGLGFLDNYPKNFAVTFGRDRQAVLEIPSGKAPPRPVVAKFNFALFERSPVRRPEDREQDAAAGAVWQLLPIYVEGRGMRRGGSPFQHVQPPRIIRMVNPDVVGDEIKDQAEVQSFELITELNEACFAA